MTPLRSGDLRHRLQVRRPIEVELENGGFRDDWRDIASVWAEVIGQDGKESVMDRALQGVSVYRIRIRWRADIKVADQLTASAFTTFRDKEVNIRSIVDPDGRREQLVIMADTESVQASKS